MASHDWYKGFADLSESEREGISYQREAVKRRSVFAIIAPHGGGIEPGTSEVARSIAGSQFSYYTFDGLKQDGNYVLHITSTLFDEPKCLQLVNSSDIVVAIHGYADNDMVIYVGGLHLELRTHIINALVEAGFNARLAEDDYAGAQLQNICNRGRSRRGVQIEISDGLRRVMFASLDRRGRKNITSVFRKFVKVIHKELKSFVER
jgi:phage replication-related protein YjqB (UPF0714/DUF867 family)